MPSTATVGTLIGQFAVPGGAALSAYPNPNSLDLFQIRNAGDQNDPQGNVMLRVSSAGVVTANPASASQTNGTLFGVYWAGAVANGLSAAQYVAAAFPFNPDNLDIFQVINPQGGVGLFHLDYLGVAYFS